MFCSCTHILVSETFDYAAIATIGSITDLVSLDWCDSVQQTCAPHAFQSVFTIVIHLCLKDLSPEVHHSADSLSVLQVWDPVQHCRAVVHSFPRYPDILQICTCMAKDQSSGSLPK